nr:Oxidoreductase family, NAD-binding Rossmann fold [uncultured bacterium]
MAVGDILIGIAFVGCAHIHTPQFVQMTNLRPEFQVQAVWDPVAERASKRAEELKSTATTDLVSIWANPSIKAVVIGSETKQHEELVLAAAQSGKHLFVEKPLGMGARDAYAMAEAIDNAGVIFQTGYFQRGTATHLFLREQVQKGAFGKITRIRHTNWHEGAIAGWFDSEWRWMAEPEKSGVGAFGDLGTHSLDILIWMLGDVESCTASVSTGTGRFGKTDETGEGMLRFTTGTIGTVAASWDDIENPVSMEICGTEGHAVIINDRLTFTSKHVPGADGRKVWKDFPKPLPHAFELFLDAVAGKKDVPLVTAREAAYRCAVMEAMYKGAKENTWIKPAAK